MQFISTEDMKKFEELGYTFSSKYTPCNVGSTYHVIVTDKDGNEVVHTQCSYGNGSGHWYAMTGAQLDAVGQLKAIINGEVEEESKQEFDTYFLNVLADWDYIVDYGFMGNDDTDMCVLFDTWEQLQGESHYEDEYDEEGNYKSSHTVIDEPSVWQKLYDLAEKGLLKPSINYTVLNVSTAFTDEYGICDGCGRIFNKTWDGLTYVEDRCEELCNDCINESTEIIECLIEEAKENFSKALPVMISEEKLEEMGYEALDTQDFSTRAEQWGESSWGYHDVHSEICKEWCKKFEGFPKLTWVGQFDATFQLYFPSNKIQEARLYVSDTIRLEVEV